jgi:hypothetical protein
LDALSELLRVIRLSGTAFIDAELTAPWAVETPPPSAIAARLAPGAGRIIPYHLVVQGACYVQLKKKKKPVELSAGHVVMFPHGDVHVLASTPGLKPLQITTDAVVKLTRADSIASTRYGGDGAQTRLICGFFACDETLSEQLVARLPKLIDRRMPPRRLDSVQFSASFQSCCSWMRFARTSNRYPRGRGGSRASETGTLVMGSR